MLFLLSHILLFARVLLNVWVFKFEGAESGSWFAWENIPLLFMLHSCKVFLASSVTPIKELCFPMPVLVLEAL